MTASERPDHYTVEEVAKIMRIAPWTARRMVRDNKFPNASKPGRQWLIPAEDLTNLLQESHGRREPNDN